MKQFHSIKIDLCLEVKNQKADAFANLTSILARSNEDLSHPISIDQRWVLSSLLPSNLEENNSVEVINEEEKKVGDRHQSNFFNINS